MQRVTWGDAREQFVREAATGAGPDVLQLAFVWPRSLGAAGALLPLDDLIKKTGIGVGGWDEFCQHEPRLRPGREDLRHPLHHRHLRARLQQGAAEGGRHLRDAQDLGRSPQGQQDDLREDGQGRLRLPRRQLRHAHDLVPLELLLVVAWLGHHRPEARRHLLHEHHAGADRRGLRLLQPVPEGRRQSQVQPLDLPVGRPRDRRGHGQRLDRDRQRAGYGGHPDRQDVGRALPGEDLALRRRSPSGGRQRLEDLLRRAHDRHQRQHAPRSMRPGSWSSSWSSPIRCSRSTIPTTCRRSGL